MAKDCPSLNDYSSSHVFAKTDHRPAAEVCTKAFRWWNVLDVEIVLLRHE